jgi:hypothetical protein
MSLECFIMMNKENWDETQKRFITWWQGEKTDSPLMWIVAKRKEPSEAIEPEQKPETPQDFHMSLDVNIPKMRNYIRNHKYLADSFPYLELNIGPGSMAPYLGSEPVFAWDTVWYKGCVKSWDNFQIDFDENNKWFKYHLDVIRQAQMRAKSEFLVSIPDIIENLDILSALRGPQDLCYDLVDEPETVKKLVQKIDELYFKYYDAFYNIVKEPDGSSCYTAFNIWGPGKTAKVQCDFSAMMSPTQYEELIVPSIRKQCRQLENSIYHLDGPAAIKHVGALMKIKELNALQWTAGAGKPDGGCKDWYKIYEKVRAAGKSLWISLYDGEYKDWINSADEIIRNFGNRGIYFIFPEMTEDQAERLIDRAFCKWCESN